MLDEELAKTLAMNRHNLRRERNVGPKWTSRGQVTLGTRGDMAKCAGAPARVSSHPVPLPSRPRFFQTNSSSLFALLFVDYPTKQLGLC